MAIRTIRTSLLRTASICLLGVVAACGSSGDSTDDPATSADGDSVLDAVDARGTVRIGVASAPPYSDLNGETGEWEGVAIDLSKLWAEKLGAELEWVSTDFGVMVAGLQSGKFDMTPVLNQTPEREGTVAFSDPIITAVSAAAVIPDRDSISTWEDLDQQGNAICVASGAADDITLTQAEPTAEIVRLKDLSACRLALQSGRVQAVFDEWHTQGQFAASTDGVAVLFPPTALGQQAVSAALNESATAADLASINDAIAEFKDSGAMGASMDTWGGVNPVEYVVGPVPGYAADLAAQEYGE